MEFESFDDESGWLRNEPRGDAPYLPRRLRPALMAGQHGKMFEFVVKGWEMGKRKGPIAPLGWADVMLEYIAHHASTEFNSILLDVCVFQSQHCS